MPYLLKIEALKDVKNVLTTNNLHRQTVDDTTRSIIHHHHHCIFHFFVQLRWRDRVFNEGFFEGSKCFHRNQSIQQNNHFMSKLSQIGHNISDYVLERWILVECSFWRHFEGNGRKIIHLKKDSFSYLVWTMNWIFLL